MSGPSHNSCDTDGSHLHSHDDVWIIARSRDADGSCDTDGNDLRSRDSDVSHPRSCATDGNNYPRSRDSVVSCADAIIYPGSCDSHVS